MTKLSISLFGTPQGSYDGAPLAFGTDKAWALLVYLLVKGDRPHSRNALAAMLWPDSQAAKALNNLSSTLTRLRDMVARPGVPHLPIITTPQTLQRNPQAEIMIDVERFDAAIDACAAHRHRDAARCLACARRLAEAVALAHGEFLEGLIPDNSPAFEDWLMAERNRLSVRLQGALCSLAAHHEQRGEARMALEHLRRMLADSPWDEEAHRQVMRLLGQSGQRAAALKQYRNCVAALQRELGVPPSFETEVLVRQIRAGALPPLTYPELRLPVGLLPFVGRRDDLHALVDSLSDVSHRLVTICGPGGIGKTRLAIEVVGMVGPSYRNGARMVDLAVARSTDDIAAAISAAISLPFSSAQPLFDQLLMALADMEILLLLDNAEHLLAHTAPLAELLRRAPGVTLLVTSRAHLGLMAEWVYTLGKLATPSEVETNALAYDAVQLLSIRMAQHHAHVQFTGAQLSTAAQLCRMADGLPLAIELAAALTDTLPLTEIVARMAQSLDTLAVDAADLATRHRSLRAVFETSWALLAPHDRRALMHCTVFAVAITPDALDAVMDTTGGESAPALSALAGHSLLRRQGPDSYALHALIRQYAAQRMAEDSATTHAAQARHSRYYLGQFCALNLERMGAGQPKALRLLDVLFPEVRVAWEWACVHGAHAQAVPAMHTLYRYALTRGLAAQAAVLITQLETALRGAKGPTVERDRGVALARLALLWYEQGDYQHSRESAEVSLTILERCAAPEVALSYNVIAELEATSGAQVEARAWIDRALPGTALLASDRAWLLASSADIAGAVGDLPTARAAAAAGVDVAREADDWLALATNMGKLSTILVMIGDLPSAVALGTEALDYMRRLDDQHGLAIMLNNLAAARMLLDGASSQVIALMEESVAIDRAIGRPAGIVTGIHSLGYVHTLLGEYAVAASYLHEGLRLAPTVGVPAVTLEMLEGAGKLLADTAHHKVAATLLALVATHPQSDQYVRERAQAAISVAGYAPTPAATAPLQFDAAIRLAMDSLDVLVAALPPPASSERFSA
ncbi:MAG: BTAD domain-containing putative transcriptional regulator [Chloroflexales bacterium]